MEFYFEMQCDVEVDGYQYDIDEGQCGNDIDGVVCLQGNQY